MKNIIIWLVVAVFGFLMMLFSYMNYQHSTENTYWKDSILYIGESEPNNPPASLQYTSMKVFLLEPSVIAKNLSEVIGQAHPHLQDTYDINTRKNIIIFPKDFTGFDESMLSTGRLPAPEANEVLAGAQVSRKGKILVNDSELEIVGKLKRNIPILSNSLILLGNSRTAEIFRQDELYDGYLVKSAGEAEEELAESLASTFPNSEFTVYQALLRARPAPFFLYMAGMAVLLFGGTLMFYYIYKLGAEIFKNTWTGYCLRTIIDYKYVFFLLHLASFGIGLLFMIFVYFLPDLNYFFGLIVGAEVSGGSGPLALAGKAYASQNIMYAAAVTFGINFTFGSLITITIPSLIIPGCGVLVVLFRSVLWGMILAPSSVTFSKVMLPHSITLLLEGEAYILAGFFALMMLIFLCRQVHGRTLFERYKNAFLVNVHGIILIAIILAVAALYEAIEVILMMKMRG